uniref:Uncharacterized protein n=1 Tax=Siphoviridae sp. ctEP635 TaxID=2825396 RepID=A0A8S5UWZ3_9CAUD|nr:MAG TPA: hypothetical protein [Siphoviridae sp. ctEP635]
MTLCDTFCDTFSKRTNRTIATKNDSFVTLCDTFL